MESKEFAIPEHYTTRNNDMSEITLLPDQQRVFNKIKEFCDAPGARVFILSGYAGTGKTTLLKKVAQWLSERNYTNAAGVNKSMRGAIEGPRFVPLASTGRAAKVLSDKIGRATATVHSWIYNFKGFNQDIARVAAKAKQNPGMDQTGQLLLKFDFEPLEQSAGNTVYIIDEASMLSDTPDDDATQATFGSGRLLTDLISYDPQGKFIFVGDDCQLPPVHGNGSPALDASYIASHFHLPVTTDSLTGIVRQASGNDIVRAAERMRRLCANPPYVKWGRFPFKGYNDIDVLPDQVRLVAQYVEQVRDGNYNAAALITGSNKSCNLLSDMLRRQLGFNSTGLMVGELLLVTQNNMPTGLMNGDLVVVRGIGRREHRAQLGFVEVEVEEVLTHRKRTTLLVEDLLGSGNTNLDQFQQKSLFIDFYYREREKEVSEKSQQFRDDLMSDSYLNALRAVYGYAITCHKAQGGEWPKVYLDVPRYLSHRPGRQAYQWLYTAMTRASSQLYVANDFFIS